MGFDPTASRVRFSHEITSDVFLPAKTLVGLSGLEPPTSRLSGVRSNRLSYKPVLYVNRLCNYFYIGTAIGCSF